jgi:threonine dehydrogenase-like Zn-dependent dehydrogenase
MSDDQAVLVEPAAIALHALKVSHAQPGECIAIIGLGTVGLLLCQFALRLGYIVFASDINEAKRHRACALGANVVDSSQSLELAATWRAHHVQYVFECAGAPQTASMAIAHAPRGSAVVLVGLCESAASFSPLRVVREGISLIPSMIYDHPSDFARTISLIDSHAMDMASLISSHYPLTSIESALRHAGQGDALKIVIDVQS